MIDDWIDRLVHGIFFGPTDRSMIPPSQGTQWMASKHWHLSMSHQRRISWVGLDGDTRSSTPIAAWSAINIFENAFLRTSRLNCPDSAQALSALSLRFGASLYRAATTRVGSERSSKHIWMCFTGQPNGKNVLVGRRTIFWTHVGRSSLLRSPISYWPL